MTYEQLKKTLLFRYSKMLEDVYGFDKTTASNINGIFYDVSLLFCPISGQIYVGTKRMKFSNFRLIHVFSLHWPQMKVHTYSSILAATSHI